MECELLIVKSIPRSHLTFYCRSKNGCVPLERGGSFVFLIYRRDVPPGQCDWFCLSVVPPAFHQQHVKGGQSFIWIYFLRGTMPVRCAGTLWFFCFFDLPAGCPAGTMWILPGLCTPVFHQHHIKGGKNFIGICFCRNNAGTFHQNAVDSFWILSTHICSDGI